MQGKVTGNSNTLYFGFIALFIIAAIVAIYLQQYAVLMIPFVVIACLYLLQHPQLLFYILIGAIPWSVEYNFNDSLGTDLPDEPFMLLTSLAVILLFLYRKPLRRITSIHPLIFIIGAQWLWIFITVFCSTDPLISTKFLAAKSWYLLAFGAMPLLLFQQKKVLKYSFATLLISMLLATVVAFVRHALYGFTFEHINDALRPFFRNHVNYSALLVCMLPVVIAAIKLSPPRKTLYSILFIFLLVALYFSYARGAWVAAVIGMMSYWMVRKKWLIFSFVMFIIITLIALLWLQNNDRYLKFAHDYRTTIFHTDFKQHLIATYELKDVSTAERFYRWIAGVRMIKDSWKTGFGPSTFYNNYRSYTIPLFRTWVSKNEEHSTVHNYFLLTIIEQGIIGFLLLLLLLGYAFYTAQKVYHRTNDVFWKTTVSAMAAILWMICTVNFLSDLIETDKVGSVFYISLATLVIADHKTKKLQQHDV